MKRWIFAMVFGLVAQFSFAHEYYYSITEIDYNESRNSLEVSIKVHTHDMEKAFQELGKTCKNSIVQHRYIGQADRCLMDYFKEHLQIFQAGRQIQVHFIGKEEYLDGNSFIYLEFKNIKKEQAVEVVNTILISNYSDQRNIVHFKKTKESKNNTFYFNGLTTRHIFELK